MSNLASKQCVPCTGGTPPLTIEQIAKFSPQIPGWQVENGHNLKRKFTFSNFQEALNFVDRAGAVAEQQGHHPDIWFGWGYAEFKIWTHAINALSESDFILAAKIDLIEKGL